MKSVLIRQASIVGISLTLLSVGMIGISEAASKLTVPGQPTRDYAVGGLSGATVYWDAPTSNGGKPITSYKIITFDLGKTRYQTDADGTVSFCNSVITHCYVAISNPERNRIKTPTPLNFFFTVAAVNAIGTGPGSVRTMPVAITFPKVVVPTAKPTPTPTFKPAPKPSPTPTIKKSPTPTPTFKPAPKPSPTPTIKRSPTSTSTGINKFDGNYQGSVVVTIAETAPKIDSITQTIGVLFTMTNGTGSGSAQDWTVSGQITDVSGTATVTASNPLYGSITLAVNFVFDSNTKAISGNGSGTRTFNLAGIGAGSVTFVFSITSR